MSVTCIVSSLHVITHVFKKQVIFPKGQVIEHQILLINEAHNHPWNRMLVVAKWISAPS